MILVDIQVPALDQVYDFELDEKSRGEELLREVCQLLTGKEKLRGGSDSMCLYSVRLGEVLKEDQSLEEQGVREGDRLILI